MATKWRLAASASGLAAAVVAVAGIAMASDERVGEIPMLRPAPRCVLPPVPAGAKLIVYGGYESEAVSSVFVGGPEQETNLIDVMIEPGSTPLYLVLTSYESMVWRLDGATGRVVRVVVSSFHTAKARLHGPLNRRRAAVQRMTMPTPVPPPNGLSASGVMGVPRDRVTISTGSCPGYFYQPPAKQALSLGRVLGRDPDAVFGSYSASSVSLPSGTIHLAGREKAPVPRGFDTATWRDAVRYWPRGLVEVDVRQVVAAMRVAPYKVLPSQMGISQLIGSGRIKPTASGAFRIVKPIARMPPSMGGAHSVKLILAKGVPLPPGDPVHSCVIAEGSTVPIAGGAHCAHGE